jgi:hypothetical protein
MRHASARSNFLSHHTKFESLSSTLLLTIFKKNDSADFALIRPGAFSE